MPMPSVKYLLESIVTLTMRLVHLRLECRGFMPFCLDALGNRGNLLVIISCQYFDQKRDAGSDPEVTLELNHAKHEICPLTFQIPGLYTLAVEHDEQGREVMNAQAVRHLSIFSYHWLRSVIPQEYRYREAPSPDALPENRRSPMMNLLREYERAMFVVDSQLLTSRTILDRWWQPENLVDGGTIRKAIESPLETCRPRQAHRKPGWRVLEVNSLDHRMAARGDLGALITHARAYRENGLLTVRAYLEIFHRWPSASNLRRAYALYLPNALRRVERYLRRRRELPSAFRSIPQPSPSGRRWLFHRAKQILGRKYLVSLGAVSGAWLFWPPEAPKKIHGGRP